MEKKGDLLNQLAIISDLIEKANITAETSVIIMELNEPEFLRVFDLVQKRYNRKTEKPKDSFRIKIGLVDIIFNMSSV